MTPRRLVLTSIVVPIALVAMIGRWTVAPASAENPLEHTPANGQAPTISGNPQPMETLTAAPGAWTEEPTTFSYRWERCYSSGGCIVDQESDSANYVAKPEDVDARVAVRVTATNAIGSGTATSASVEVKPSWHFATGPPRLEITPLSAGLTAPPWATARALGLGITSGMCVGEGRPSIGNIKVRERPADRRLPFPSAIITASVLFPSPVEVVGTVNPGEVHPGCGGVGVGLGRRIVLKRPSARLFIYDGSQTPPRLVLKPAKIVPWTLRRVVGADTIEIQVPYATCAGFSVRPHIVEQSRRTIITAYEERPVFHGSRGCLRVRGFESQKVKLGRRVVGLELLDGSLDPPVLRGLSNG